MRSVFFFARWWEITHVQVVASCPLSVTGFVDAPRESLRGLSFEDHDGPSLWVRGGLSHPASCSAGEVTTLAAPSGWHALIVVKGLTVQTQRVHLVMLESFRSAVISEALDRPSSTLGFVSSCAVG